MPSPTSEYWCNFPSGSIGTGHQDGVRVRFRERLDSWFQAKSNENNESERAGQRLVKAVLEIALQQVSGFNWLYENGDIQASSR